MARVGNNAKSSFGLGLIAVTLIALASMPAMAIRTALVSTKAYALADSVKAAVARWEKAANSPTAENRRVPRDMNAMFKFPLQQKTPELLGIWGTSCLFSDAKGGVKVYEVGDKIGAFTVDSIEGLTVVLNGEDGPRRVNITPYKPPPGWKPKTKKKAATGKQPATRPKAAPPAPRPQRSRFAAMPPEVRRLIIEAIKERRKSRGRDRGRRRRRR